MMCGFGRFGSATLAAAALLMLAPVAAAQPKCSSTTCGVVQNVQQVAQKGNASGVGLVGGAVLGGVLGHQIGGGRGKDVATVAGAVGGVAIGSNVGRSQGGAVYDQDVQRCAAVPGSANPEYWDVTYYFGGTEHHVQMATQPGPTIWVNGRGEPRG